MNELATQEDATPTEIHFKGQTLTSAKLKAEKFADFLDKKTEKIRNEVDFENFKAIKIFKGIVKRVEEDVKFKPVTIKEVKGIIRGLKSTNSRGNTDITNRIVKALINYLGVTLTHLINCIFKTGIYPQN